MSVVLFLGAGASKPLGFPTTAEFFDKQKSGVAWSPAHKDVFEQIRKFLRKDIVDVEDALRLLDPCNEYMSSESGKFFDSFLRTRNSENLSDRVIQTAIQMKERCFDVYGDTPDIENVSGVYSSFLNELGWENRKICLFTTNYDLSTDQLLRIADERGIAASDGFDRWGRFNIQDYDQIGSSGIAIHRLHGSMSWVENNGEIINTRTISRTQQKHLFIAPGYKGDPESSNESKPIIFAHQSLARTLGEAHLVIVVGFSFRDLFINRLFDTSFRNNKVLKMILVNPEFPDYKDSGFKDLYERYKGRIEHLDMPFGDNTILLPLQPFLHDEPVG